MPRGPGPVTVTLNNVDSFTCDELVHKVRDLLCRQAFRDHPRKPKDCSQYGGGVITNERACTDPSCGANHTAPICALRFNTAQRFELWQKALGDPQTGVVQVRPRLCRSGSNDSAASAASAASHGSVGLQSEVVSDAETTAMATAGLAGKRKAEPRVGIVVTQDNVGKMVMSQLPFAVRDKLCRAAFAAYPRGDDDCSLYGGSVITNEDRCTKNNCQANHGAQICKLRIGDKARFKLWQDALGDKNGHVEIFPKRKGNKKRRS